MYIPRRNRWRWRWHVPVFVSIVLLTALLSQAVAEGTGSAPPARDHRRDSTDGTGSAPPAAKIVPKSP